MSGQVFNFVRHYLPHTSNTRLTAWLSCLKYPTPQSTRWQQTIFPNSTLCCNLIREFLWQKVSHVVGNYSMIWAIFFRALACSSPACQFLVPRVRQPELAEVASWSIGRSHNIRLLTAAMLPKQSYLRVFNHKGISFIPQPGLSYCGPLTHWS